MISETKYNKRYRKIYYEDFEHFNSIPFYGSFENFLRFECYWFTDYVWKIKWRVFTGNLKRINWSRKKYRSKYSRMDQVKFLMAVFHKFYLVHSWILCPICNIVYTCTVKKTIDTNIYLKTSFINPENTRTLRF